MMTPRFTTMRGARALLGALALLPLLALAQPVAAAPPPPAPPTIAVPAAGAAQPQRPAGAAPAQVQAAAPAGPTDVPTPPATVTPTPTPGLLPTPTPNPVPTSSAGTTLAASPPDGLPKTQIALNGTGFKAGQDVQLRWDQGATLALASGQSSPVKTDGDGHFYTKVLIPDSPAAGGNEIGATVAGKTAYTLVKVDAPTTNTDEGLCFDLLGAHVCIPTPSSIMYGIANNITHFWGNVFSVATAGFNPALTSSPDITKQSAYSGIKSMQHQLSAAAGGLLVFFLTIGALAGYLTAIGRGQFQPLLAPVARAIFVTGFVAGYDTFMSKGFGIIGDFANGINGISVGANETGFDALGHAFGSITSLLSPEVVIKAAIILFGVIISLLAVVIRYLALGYLDLLYTIGPLCLVTYVSPQFSFIARWWWRTTLGLALYPVAYALVLKIIANVLTISNNGFNVFDQSSTAIGDLAALGLVLMIYRVPAMVGSLVGAGAGVFGSAASAATDAGIAAGVSLATRGLGDRILGNNRPTPGGQP